ncbi:MAG: hypothetical protein Q8Q07_06150 [Dehalococcoidales bacterium]|nr:hypothetical protein [Dehalococcoidales bacterium]
MKWSIFKSATFWAVFGLSLVLVAVLGGTGFIWAQNRQSTENITTYYRFDPGEERWVKAVVKTGIPENPDGSVSPGHHTIEIFIDENNPVKEILIEETLVIDRSGNLTGPLLEIKGHESGGTGKLNIGTLALIEVDAEELKIDADIMGVTIEKVVAEEDEIDLDLRVVNVVRTGRGAASSLLLGISRDQRLEKFGTGEKIELGRRGFTAREAGLRVDRIRIIGPESGTGFIETLIIKQSSVFGKIEVDDVKIQDLILKQISLDDSP